MEADDVAEGWCCFVSEDVVWCYVMIAGMVACAAADC